MTLTPAPGVAYPRRVWSILTGDANLARYAWTCEHATSRPLLDVGCSWGYGSTLLALRSPGVVAADADPAACEATARLATANRATLAVVVADAYALPFADGEFPCVCCSEVLEHLQRPGDALAELVRVCSGTLLVTVPAHGAMRSTVGHIQDFAGDALVAMIEAAGARVAEHTIAYPFQYVRADAW